MSHAEGDMKMGREPQKFCHRQDPDQTGSWETGQPNHTSDALKPPQETSQKHLFCWERIRLESGTANGRADKAAEQPRGRNADDLLGEGGQTAD